MDSLAANRPSASPPALARLSRLFGFACRYALAITFLMAGITKVTDLQGFAQHLRSISGLSENSVMVLAALLPWLELTCGLCLALGCAVREAALILSLLLVLLLIYALTHLHAKDCGCFFMVKALPDSPIWWRPVRNGLLLMCSIRVAWK